MKFRLNFLYKKKLQILYEFHDVVTNVISLFLVNKSWNISFGNIRDKLIYHIQLILVIIRHQLILKYYNSSQMKFTQLQHIFDSFRLIWLIPEKKDRKRKYRNNKSLSIY